jgi:hypothetical protein
MDLKDLEGLLFITYYIFIIYIIIYNLSGSGMREISRLDGELLASQEECCLMEIVVFLSMFMTANLCFNATIKQDRNFTVSSA